MGAIGFSGALETGIIEVYSGAQPADADAAETGTKLLRITVNGGAFVAGNAANGLTLEDPVAGVAVKETTEVWSGLGLANGTAGWYRFYANDYITGLSTTAKRLDGVCAVGGGQFSMSTLSIALNAPVTVDGASFTMPAGA
ncbi:MAG: hypothetical protein M0R68_03965 [Bacteroidetes bacterium]|nr:hypothetical protein [Bacteroidota bacterium]